jgi:hypothetical protein
MTDQQPEEFEDNDGEDVEAHKRRQANEEPDAVDEGEDDEVEAHRRHG